MKSVIRGKLPCIFFQFCSRKKPGYSLYMLPITLLSRSSSGTSTNSNGSDATGTPKTHFNRLANEKSPYLLQHATNPVDWYPWCNEALEKAKQDDKPIFLSIGYSTCHWCHVMERESFENEAIAAIMNKHFINIKVDREERPDVDKVYMTYVQATSGSGGWPLSVWLTPDLMPIYGGTYFPPNERYYGRPGFTTVLQAIAKKWRDDRDKIQKSGAAVIKLLEEEIKIKAPKSSLDVGLPALDTVHRCFQIYSKTYDPIYGGFSKAPKFPQAVIFNFLFRYYAQHPTGTQNQLAKDMCLHTLKLMARGGIHDHLAKGFHRYSTDEQWHVPHFEKMLYDQAQLAAVYAEAYQISKESVYADVAKGILAYVSRDLSDDLGGFYSAEDADSYPNTESDSKREGAFCVWTKKEVEKILDISLTGHSKHKMHELMCTYFDIRDTGNVNPYQDPHEELQNKNVLIIRNDKAKIAKEFGLSLDELKENLMIGYKLMFEARLRRPVPHLDDKMIASWNGLMLRGFVKVGIILDEQKNIDRAIRAATFIRENLYDPNKRVLLRSSYHSGAATTSEKLSEQLEGFVDDYAFVIQGLMDLYEGTGNTYWLQWAEELQLKQDELFWDENVGGYFMTTGNDPSVILRLKEDQDGAEPSANSVSIMNLLRLSMFLDEPKYQEQAKNILLTFVDRIQKVPHAIPQMMSGLLQYHLGLKRIVIVGDRESSEVQAFVKEINSFFLPNKVLIYADDDDKNFLYTRIKMLKQMKVKAVKPAIFVCEGQTCSLPITTMEELRTTLQSKRHPM